MKNTLFVFGCLLLIICGPYSTTQAQSSDLQAIEKVLTDYMYGSSERDPERVASAFHPDAKMKMIRDGEYREVNAKEYFSKPSKGPKIERTNEIVTIDIAGYVAVAKLRLKYETRQFTDYMTLMKIDGAWKIINKAFYYEEF